MRNSRLLTKNLVLFVLLFANPSANSQALSVGGHVGSTVTSIPTVEDDGVNSSFEFSSNSSSAFLVTLEEYDLAQARGPASLQTTRQILSSTSLKSGEKFKVRLSRTSGSEYQIFMYTITTL